jgi:hypothetical protein
MQLPAQAETPPDRLHRLIGQATIVGPDIDFEPASQRLAAEMEAA